MCYVIHYKKVSQLVVIKLIIAITFSIGESILCNRCETSYKWIPYACNGGVVCICYIKIPLHERDLIKLET